MPTGHAEESGNLDWDIYENRARVIGDLRKTLAACKTLADWPHNKPTLKEWLSHKSELLRWELCAAIAEYAKTDECVARKRNELVYHLTRQLNSKSLLVRNGVPKLLLRFKADDFSEESKKILEERFNKEPTKEMVLIVGLAGIDGVHERIQHLAGRSLAELSAGRFYGTNAWAALLVTARNGDKTSIKRLLKAIDSENNPVIQVATLLRELEYVQQPEIVDYLAKYLDSKERLEPEKPTAPGTQHAQYAAVSLARMLKGWPVVKEDLNYAEEELERCRQWISSQKEWYFR